MLPWAHPCLATTDETGPFADNYVTSTYQDGDFTIADSNGVCGIYVDAADYRVCQIAAACLADDIEQVCGTRPALVNDMSQVSGSCIVIGTLGQSEAIDTLVTESKIDVTEISGQWETSLLQVVDQSLVIAGCDRRGTAFGVFDLSEKMGVSPWSWWADVPVQGRDTVVVQQGRYQQGPPSVKYRGIFINDEDWGLHPWSKKTYAPDDGYIGPKTYRKVFELLLRLKANHIWPAMHSCTKAFNAFEENKEVADDYAIVMGSSHCEQMLRNNVWEWSRWSPADGSSQGDWDWCTNADQISEYWLERVQTNADYENIYTMGMRGIHDGSMPCSGATNAQKVTAMEEEIFPAQQAMLSEWVDSDLSNVPQIFCPYKEVLTLYNLDMEVPEDITLVWPDDNHGYIRRLSNTSERQRSGRAGVYYHMSYWGSPHDYLWLCSTPPALIWEEMKKAYDYGADQVWVFNVGDIKPAEIDMEFALRLAWDIDVVDTNGIQDYLELWAWRQFGAEYKQQIAEILVDYYRLGQTRKPEHLSSSGASFTAVHYGDEMQQRIDAYQGLTDEANSIYQALPATAQDAFYQLILYPVRCAGLMNQKILYALKSSQYAAQDRVSANDCAALSQAAYAQIQSETDYYNNEMADGKWQYLMDAQPRDLSIFDEPGTSTVTPVSGPSMGIVLEGQTIAVDASDEPPSAFSDDFSSGTADDAWQPINTGRWDVRSYGRSKEYAINTSDYSSLSGDRLGALSVIEDHVYQNFEFHGRVRSCDSFSSNSSADLALVFGYTDELNYNYLILSSRSSNSGLYRIVGGTRSLVQMVSVGIPDNDFHDIVITQTADGLTIAYNGSTLLTTSTTFSAGLIGVGSYNDSAAFTEIEIEPLAGSSSTETLPTFDVFTQNRCFIDVFNKGDTAFTWAAAPAANWIQVEPSSGTVETQQRVWVSIDWDQASLGENEYAITFTGAGETLSVKANVFNPNSPRPDDLAGFVQANGYVSMEAEHYSSRSDGDNAGWREITTLGRTGDSMTLLPTTTESIEDTAGLVEQSPVLEYQVYLWEAGQQEVTVYALPTHAITSEQELRYAVAFDDQTPQIVEYDTTEWSSQWSINVLQGIAESSSTHTLADTGQHTLRIWMVDPGVVLDKIVIGDAPASHLGPPETMIQ